MAVLVGVILDNFETVDFNTQITSSLNSLVKPVGGTSDAAVSLAGIITTVIPSEFSEVKVGSLLSGFYGDYYNKFHILPPLLDLGNISGGQTSNVEIFNTYNTPLTLNSITEANTSGISYPALGFPITINPKESIVIVFDISLNGPPSINGTYTFNFTESVLGTVLTIIGSRIVLFPYYFSAPMKETNTWLTDIISSKNGTEQRFENRDENRQQFNAVGIVNHNELSILDNLFYGWNDRNWAVPVWSEAKLNISVSPATTIITMDTTNSSFKVGDLAIIWQSSTINTTFTIILVSPTQIVSESEIPIQYTNAVVVPIKICRMMQPPTRFSTGYKGKFSITMEVINNTPLLSANDIEPFGDGIEIYLKEPALRDVYLSDQYEKLTNVVDFLTGGYDRFSPWINTRVKREIGFLFDGLAEIWLFREWLHRRKGKLIPFYMPTFENNIRLISTGTLVSNINIVNDETYTHASLRVHIAFKLKSGLWSFSEVSSYTLNPNNTVTMNLSTAPVIFGTTTSFTTEEVDYISYVGLKRLNSDRIELNWKSNYIAETNFPIIELSP